MGRELSITRVYDATPQQLWDAWTQPEQLARWWGKRGWNARPETIELDVRPGGTFRVTTVNDEDGSEMTNEGTYDEVDEPHRLTFGETVVTFTARDDGRTEMHFHTTTEAQDELFQRMRGGLESAFGRLEEALKP
ncbi:MAG TPA: SRPBCC domain-containing protein [Solirubrobacter sp.]